MRKLNDRNVTRIRISFEVLGFDEDCERTLNFVELFRRRENRDGLCWECKLVSHVHRFCLDPNVFRVRRFACITDLRCVRNILARLGMVDLLRKIAGRKNATDLLLFSAHS